MSLIRRLAAGERDFPETTLALAEPNGLLAAGGDLSPGTLLAAYERGIFPWYQAPQPILWWSPDPRSVILPGQLHLSRSLRRELRKNRYTITFDRAFEAVVRCCAETREDGLGTWIDEDMVQAYCALHRRGYAHSIEVWDDGDLVGGLYGVALGTAFFGESMFSRRSNTSKIALVALVTQLEKAGFGLFDCQVESPHMNSMGAINLPRLDFERRLAQTVTQAHDPAIWAFSRGCGELL